MNLKEVALLKLKEINSNAEPTDIITKLMMYIGDKSVTVEDYSFFANSNYMSEGLLSALRNGRTLTQKEGSELNQYAIEASVVI